MTDVKKSEIYPVFGCEICFVAIYAMFCVICFVAIINNGGDDVTNMKSWLYQAMGKVIKSYAVQPVEEMILAALVITSAVFLEEFRKDRFVETDAVLSSLHKVQYLNKNKRYVSSLKLMLQCWNGLQKQVLQFSKIGQLSINLSIAREYLGT